MYYFNFYINTLVLTSVFILSIASVTINGLLLYVLPRVRDRKNVMGIQLLMGVATGDIISGLMLIGMCVTRIIIGYPGNYNLKWYCPIFSSGIFYHNGMCGVLLSFVAIERFVLVCLNKKIPIALTWTLFSFIAIIYAIPMFWHAVQGGFFPDATYVFCFPYGSDIATIATNASTFIFSVPLVILSVCYTSIFIKCLFQQRSQVSRLSKQAAVRSLLFIIVYLLCYMPKFIETIWRVMYSIEALPLYISVMVPISLLFVWPLNPILVLFLHYDVKEKIYSMFWLSPITSKPDF